MMLLIPACQGPEEDTSNKTENTSVEQSDEMGGKEVSDDRDTSYQKKEVSPEFDEDGNPTGEYAQYLWEQQQMEEAKKSMAEDAMREHYEDMYNDDHSGGFPLD